MKIARCTGFDCCREKGIWCVCVCGGGGGGGGGGGMPYLCMFCWCLHTAVSCMSHACQVHATCMSCAPSHNSGNSMSHAHHMSHSQASRALCLHVVCHSPEPWLENPSERSWD